MSQSSNSSPVAAASGGLDASSREKLLLEMYKQMHADINRHILVVWQSVSVLIGAFAVLALVEKALLPVDLAAALILLICWWQIAHVLDASYWYNRNLIIIANVERQFLRPSDLREIHYYWGAHRKNKPIMHLLIQGFIGLGVAFVIVAYHFMLRVLPGLIAHGGTFDPLRSLPYGILLIGLILLICLWRNRNASYSEMLANSPGIHVDVKDVKFGVGHGQAKSTQVD